VHTRRVPIGSRAPGTFHVAYIRFDMQPYTLWSPDKVAHVQRSQLTVYVVDSSNGSRSWRMSSITDLVVSRHDNDYGVELMMEGGWVDPNMLVMDLAQLTVLMVSWARAEPAIS